jgi:hypothetical protein
MSEFMGQLPKNIEDKAKKVFREKLSQKIINAFSSGNLENIRELASKHLEQLGVQPAFVQENNPQLQEMRNKLNAESGIIICNHPGWGDTAAILSVVERDDFKIMMNRNYFDLLPPDVADKYFLTNETDPTKTIAIFKKIQTHIREGGVLLTYPSGGNEQKEGTRFKDGFRVILRGLKPEQMVYCFNINNDDMANLKSHNSKAGLASEILLPALSLKKSKSPQIVRVDEAYTKAGEWQEAIEAIPKNDASAVLTEKYESMFLSDQN